MKKFSKYLVCILSISLICFVINVSATDVIAQIDIDEAQPTVTETEVAVQSNSARPIADGVYKIMNGNSGKYLNVHNGVNANNTNVYQYTDIGSAQQQFRVVYDTATSSYKIYAMCSSNGTHRVLDIIRGGSSLASGQNVDIWTPVDPTAQNWTITHLGDGCYRISPTANTSLALTTYGYSDGTAEGRTATSDGNVFISAYVGTWAQIWTFTEVQSTTPSGYFESMTDSANISGITGWAWQHDQPNAPINVKIYIKNAITNEVEDYYIVTANLYREDLVSTLGNGYHGFYLTINWDTVPYGSYKVEIYAIGTNNSEYRLNNYSRNYTVSNRLGYLSYAVYRDLTFNFNFGNGLIEFDDWHAGLMSEAWSNSNLSVFHIPAPFNQPQWIDWNGFVAGETYRGTYKPQTEMTHNDRLLISVLAAELNDNDIAYNPVFQLWAQNFEGASKIQPEHITSMRCDGVVEYCYEYYGYMVFGEGSQWDISLANNNFEYHNILNIMPKKQAQQYLSFVTSSVPNDD